MVRSDYTQLSYLIRRHRGFLFRKFTRHHFCSTRRDGRDEIFFVFVKVYRHRVPGFRNIGYKRVHRDVKAFNFFLSYLAHTIGFTRIRTSWQLRRFAISQFADLPSFFFYFLRLWQKDAAPFKADQLLLLKKIRSAAQSYGRNASISTDKVK